MNKYLKWSVIVAGIIITLLLILIISLALKYDRYNFYSSGGPLSVDQAAYDVGYYDLNIKVLPEEQSIKGRVGVTLSVVADSLDRIELDLIDNFDVGEVVDGEGNSVDYDHDDDKLWLYPKTPLLKNQPGTFIITYSGHPIEAIFPPWVDGFVWSKDSSDLDWIGVTCQGEGAKIWFPCKNHPSDEPDSAAINISIPENLYCAANGKLVSISEVKDGYKTFHWKTRYTINNYNINPSIGNYQIKEIPYYSEDSSIIMPVRFYYLPTSEKNAQKHLEMARDMLYTYRKYYGEYPWIKEKFAIVETDYLGMEHQTINAYGNKFRYYKTKDGQEYDELMLHEMGHEWWGNKVSVKDWGDFWIHEGICTYGEALYMLDKSGESEYQRHIRRLRKRIQNNVPIIPKRNANSSESYNGDIYSKGALLMHSLRFILGDSLFFKTLKDFATEERFTYKNLVETDDLIKLIQENSGKDYGKYINYYLTTTDLIDVKTDSVDTNKYSMYIPNIDFYLPMEIQTDKGIVIHTLGKEPQTIESASTPIPDPNDWYLKKSFKEKKKKGKN